MSGKLGPDIVTDGLVLCLDAADKRSYPGSGNTWYDLSGNNNHGTLVNNTYFDSSEKNSFSFDGVSDYINLGVRASLLLEQEETIIAWIRPTNIDGNRRARIGNRHSGFLTVYGSRFAYEGMNNAGSWVNNAYTASNTVEINTWQQIAFTFKADDKAILYKSGYQIGEKSVTGSQTNLYVGAYVIGTETLGGWGTPAYFEGNIGSVISYGRSLSASEIQQNYKMMKGRYNL